MAGNWYKGPTIKKMDVVVEGGPVRSYKFSIAGKTRRNMGWVRKTYEFTAISESSLLKFISRSGSAFGPALDDVRVAKIADGPVPPTALFITPILNVSDVAAAVRWFVALGWELGYAYAADGQVVAVEDGAAAPTFACITAGTAQIFLCLGYEGLRGEPVAPGSGEDAGATWQIWWLDSRASLDALRARVEAAGVTIVGAEDTAWGQHELRIAHPDGHVFRVSAPVA
jgi:catechol 2,3-dioxygenase-like lactoylglutathione lyase family enzyme